MAIEKYSPNDIPDLNQDWGQDANDPQLRPYSGRAVQKIIREQLTELRGAKFGHVAYVAGSLIFYDEDNGTILSTVSLSGRVYTITLETSTLQTFTVLNSETTKIISITPSSKGGYMDSELTELIEDYTWIMSVDNGNGFNNVLSGTCRSGQSFYADIRPYLTIGFNPIRFLVTGELSGQTKSIVFTANLTSLSLNVLHTWQKAWIENEPYYINGIFFSGNMQKTLNIRIDDDDSKLYTQVFSASTSYVSSQLAVDLTNYFPGTTGVHKVDVWIAGPGVETKHYIFDIMCVEAADKLSAKLVCLNEVKTTAYNYEDQELFKFATYGTNEVIFDIIVDDALDEYPIAIEQSLVVNAEEKIPYALRLEVPTEEMTGLSLTVSANADVDPQIKVIGVNNSNAFAPISNANFYMNASLRSNGSNDRETILNNVNAPTVYEYPAIWTGFAWEKDGWGTDNEDVKCLSVQAGSTVAAETFRPLSILGAGRNLTIEWKLKTDNVADYDTPIMTLMSDEVYNPDTTNGIIVYPTSILVLSSVNRNTVQQSVLFEEGHQLHFVVVFQREYGTTGRNLCRISINGVQQCVFEYDGAAAFGNGYLKLGQESTDLYLYMLRYYNDKAFEADSVLRNWLNALTETVDHSRQGIRSDNDIFDGINISYELTKQQGFNTMVVEMQNDVAIPSLTNAISAKSSVAVEYNDHPEWNFKITNAPVDGQGTTSKRYYRWNLRWKLAKGSNASIWTYADGSTSTTKGWFDGVDNHIKVGRITAKKNIASSSQGHKMGATLMYHELYHQLGLDDNLLSNARVAVYQYPVMGFQKYADGSYQFIGLYTIGPDKGDKDTFGYDTKIYPELLSIEGPNHAPLGTRFLHPWIDVVFDEPNETLTFGGEEGWDIAAYNDSKYSTPAGVLTLYENEWKPAYDLVYFCSSYLKSIAETGLTLGQINADVITFRNASNLLTTRRNEVVTLYDENYNLVYFSNAYKRYELLVGHDVRTYLDGYLVNMVDPTTEDLIAARKAKFLAEVGNYFDIEALLYHENFLMLIGASDNHAKNFYPFKLEPLAAGGRWQFRQDDLDTILATDNNGNPTKKYYVEPGDLTPGGTDIYQGSSSVLWTLVREVFANRLRDMMVDMINGLVSMASSKGMQKPYVWQTVFAMFDHYFWRNSARYFPVRAYGEDATFSYVYPWSLNPGATYNGVYPLTQALGTQLEAEMHWALRRIIYVFSKYSIGGFTGSTDDGLNSIEFTPGQAFTFNLTPAINMYPSGNLGGGTNIVGSRTIAGDSCPIVATSDGTTTYYLKGLDWLTSLGDLSGLVLTSRGGVSTINFSVKSKRLRTFKVGDADELNVLFNATALAIQGEALEEIDVRNVKTITSPVDLGNCPRLKVAKFEGSSVPTVILPVGSKINYLSLPINAQNLYLNGLPILSDANLSIRPETFMSIRGLYLANCPHISIAGLLRVITRTPGNNLRFIHLSLGTTSGTASDLTTLAALTEPYDSGTDSGYGRVVYDSVNKIYSYSDQKPYLQGTINLNEPAYTKDVSALRNYFNLLTINATAYYVWFEDPEVLRMLLSSYGGGTGLTEQMVANISSIGALFYGNTIITEFNELKKFTAITALAANAFNGCYSLKSIELPDNLVTLGNSVFADCVSLIRIVLPAGLHVLGSNSDTLGIFENCMSLTDINLNYITNIGKKAFKGAIAFNGGVPTNVITIGDEAYYGCIGMTGLLSIPNTCTSIGQSAFENCENLSGDLILGDALVSLGTKAFKNAGCTGDLIIGNGLTTIPTEAFSGAKFTGDLTIGNSVTTIRDNAFAGVSFTGNLHLPASLTNLAPGSIPLNSFTSLSLGLGYDLNVYNDFSSANFSAESLNSSILNCASGSPEDRKVINISFSAYKSLLAFNSNAVIDAEARYISVRGVGFNSFISPKEFIDPAMFVGFGEDMNIYEAYNAYPNVNKKMIWTVRPATTSTVLPSIANGSYAYKEDYGVMTDYTIISSGTIAWKAGSSKRHVIFISTESELRIKPVSNNVIFGSASWLYIGRNCLLESIRGSSGVSGAAGLRYIHMYQYALYNNNIGSGFAHSLTNLTGHLTIPDGVTTIGESAFTACSNLTDLSLPNSVNTIEPSAFYGCSNLESDLDLSNITSFGSIWIGAHFQGCVKLKSVILSPQMTYIPKDFLRGCSALSVMPNIPASVTWIGSNAFNSCYGLTGSLTIPNSVTSIEDASFKNCSGFNGNLVLSTSLKTIGYTAFQDCSGFTGNLNIPDGVTNIQQKAFERCAGFNSISLPNSLTMIDDFTFSGCTNITGQVTLPDNITVIKLEAFSFCPNITSIVFPSNLQRVSNSIFRESPGLIGNITFPATMIEIGGWAFQDAASLTSVTCLATTPPILGSGAFRNTVSVYVPAESVNAYKGASGWSAFASRIFAIQ